MALSDDREIKYNVEFLFRQTKIQTDNQIGRGAYGEVFYAKCDSLLCAAKRIHGIFREEYQHDPTNRAVLDGFAKEYAYLSSMKHPNIVQYLGYYVDRDNESYLLMELMDESLTHYLEKLDGPVPFHKTINFTHDIAMGLDYLHYNAIMHCDLSSHNVLLVASYRAKISDFGQSLLVSADSGYRVRGELAPGTTVYMPPEALREPPEFSSKLDNFSLGVLMIQILTSLWPNPSKSTTTLEGTNPDSAGTDLPIKELVRRAAHLAMIDHRHPLHQLALYCIKDDENDRPDIIQICDSLSEIKEHEPEYKESKKLNPYEPIGHVPKTDTQYNEMKKQIRELQNANGLLESEAVKMRFIIEKKSAILEQTGVSVQNGATSTGTTPDPVRRQNSQQESPSPPHPNTAPLPGQDILISNKKLQWYPCTKSPAPLYGGSAIAIGNRAYVSGQALDLIYEYNSESNSWATLPRAPTASFALVSIAGLLTIVGGYDKQGYSNALHSLMKVGDSLVWQQSYPPMKDSRVSPGAASNDRVVVVAGGDQQTPGSRILSNSCEILDIQTREWTIADRLPKPVKRMSLTLCGDRLCIVGGISNRDQPLSEMFYTSLQQLSNSAAKRGISGDIGRSLKFDKCWNTMPVPCVYGTCTTLCGYVVLIGGWGNKPSNAVFVFDPSRSVGNSAWHYIGPLPLARMDATCAVLSGERLLVIGGRSDSQQNPVLSAVEIACPYS